KGAGKGALEGRKNRDGSKEGLENSLSSKDMGKADMKSAIGDAKDKKSAMKAKASQRYASKIGKTNDKGTMSNQLRNQSLSNYQTIRSEEMANSINEDAKGSDKYAGVVKDSNQPFSKNLTANKDSVDEITGDQHMYENSTKSDLRTMSSRASEEAESYRMSGDQKPAFSQEEVNSLSEATDENDFVDRLHNTNNGMAYAMQTENAQNAMQGTKFVDENGEVQTNKIADYHKQVDRKVGSGEVLSKEELKDKATIDSAFIMGAKEKYREPSSKFKDKIGYRQADNTNNNVENSKKKRDSSNIAKRNQSMNNKANKRRDNIKTQTTRRSRPSTQSSPKTRPTRPSTQSRPKTRQTRPSTQSSPKTRPSRPSTQSSPKTRPSRPSTQSSPKTRPSRPSTQSSPKTRPSRPSTQSSPKTTTTRPSTQSRSNSSTN